MSVNRATLEVIAPTIEEAVAKGLTDLGLPKEAVKIEILDEGSKGLFGLGSRHARVRLIILNAAPEDLESEGQAEQEEIYRAPEPEPEPEEAPVAQIARRKDPEEDQEEDQEDDQVLEIARVVVTELLQKMGVHASVSAHYGEAEVNRSHPPVLVDISGKDLSILIGRQAETLNALQYIAALITSKEVGHSVTLGVDVQGFRARREQQIRQLARRMADQAVKTDRRQVLEPMPANERRWIHLELRNHPNVTTESVGEEPRRKVTIVPK